MKQTCDTSLNIKKPLKPHRQIEKHEIPSTDEIKKRYDRIEKLNRFGIDTTTLDMNKSEIIEYEEDIDKLKASILIMQDKEIPEDLEKRLLEYKENQAKES